MSEIGVAYLKAMFEPELGRCAARTGSVSGRGGETAMNYTTPGPLRSPILARLPPLTALRAFVVAALHLIPTKIEVSNAVWKQAGLAAVLAR